MAVRLGDKGFMSYGQVWPRLGHAIRGLADDEFISMAFSSYKDEWKNQTIREGYTLLRDYFGGRGNWYPARSKPIYVLGFWFKPSIKGIWYVDGQAYAVAINLRKGQPLSEDDARFMARGIYELHCIDDPNDPVPLILDVSEQKPKAGRSLRPHLVQIEDTVPLATFEDSIREFLVALNVVGLSLPPPPDLDSVVDLFRR
ncbi:hypothetical protein [Bauldia sp.]|uniref:hypothetical protein n=1 Tax=Bauldia sp. TaxID=2575872 RepID=UPI003BA8C503